VTTLERPPAHIDPRIRARRIAVQRGRGRRRLQWLLDIGLVVLVVAGFAVALRSPLLDVDRVVVAGGAHTPDDLVLERAGIAPGDQLMDLDLGAAGEAVTTLPWVARVDLHRQLDGVVRIRITERTPVAVVGTEADAVLVDGDGQAVALAADAPEVAATLVHLTAADGVPAPGQVIATGFRPALTLATVLAATGPGLALELHNGAELVGTLTDSGIEVRFGDERQLDAKVASLRTVLAQVDLTCAAVIDLEAPGSPVLTREEGCS
jgi:cell division protein FtsQ